MANAEEFLRILFAAPLLADSQLPGLVGPSSLSSHLIEAKKRGRVIVKPGAVDDLIKRPLSHQWVFWKDSTKPHNKVGMKTEDFSKHIQKAGHFQTLQELSQLWTKMVRYKKLHLYSNIRVFRAPVTPLWEDPNNRDGGRYVILVHHNRTVQESQAAALPMAEHSDESGGESAQKFSNLKLPPEYLLMILHVVTGLMGPETGFCGVVLSVRRFGMMITIWDTDANDKEWIEDVRHRLAKLLNIPAEGITYQRQTKSIRNNVRNLTRTGTLSGSASRDELADVDEADDDTQYRNPTTTATVGSEASKQDKHAAELIERLHNATKGGQKPRRQNEAEIGSASSSSSEFSTFSPNPEADKLAWLADVRARTPSPPPPSTFQHSPPSLASQSSSTGALRAPAPKRPVAVVPHGVISDAKMHTQVPSGKRSRKNSRSVPMAPPQEDAAPSGAAVETAAEPNQANLKQAEENPEVVEQSIPQVIVSPEGTKPPAKAPNSPRPRSRSAAVRPVNPNYVASRPIEITVPTEPVKLPKKNAKPTGEIESHGAKKDGSAVQQPVEPMKSLAPIPTTPVILPTGVVVEELTPRSLDTIMQQVKPNKKASQRKSHEKGDNAHATQAPKSSEQHHQQPEKPHNETEVRSPAPTRSVAFAGHHPSKMVTSLLILTLVVALIAYLLGSYV